MDVRSIQSNLGNALVELEVEVPQLTALQPQEASMQITQTKKIIMDTQVRLTNSLTEMAEVERRLNEKSINEQEQQSNQVVNNLNEIKNMEKSTMTINKKEIKAFNLNKQAAFGDAPFGEDSPAVPFGADSLNETAELGEEQFNVEENLMQEGNLNRNAFTDFLSSLASDPQQLFGFVKENTLPEYGEENDKNVEQFNMIVGDPTKIDESDQLAGDIYDRLINSVKETPEGTEQGVFTSVAETNDIIKKLAEQHVKKQDKAFNLQKTAQHKTVENVILHGPDTKRFDPFLRQPVSDWSIIERNKGFGLTFDDVWDIDYEAIWRGTVMDKYSRPYRDKEGNWVGGYINKRFEVDHNIPATNNLQLKPGEMRRATPPEFGNTESRLQAARAAGEIEGGPDMNTDKPFNWQKEASSKKKS